MLFDTFSIARIVVMAIGLLVAIDIHECAHAWMANQLGDPTARYYGRLSLNPLVHLDPMGTLMMVFSLFYGFGIGWGKPVPVNPYNLRKGPRVGMGMVAAAGPLSNLAMAAAVGLPLRMGLPLPSLLSFLLSVIVSVNIGLAIFNMLPLFPLDGYSVLMGILESIREPWAYKWSEVMEDMQTQGPMILIFLIMVGQFSPRLDILRYVIGPLYRLFCWLITGSSQCIA